MENKLNNSWKLLSLFTGIAIPVTILIIASVFLMTFGGCGKATAPIETTEVALPDENVVSADSAGYVDEYQKDDSEPSVGNTGDPFTEIANKPTAGVNDNVSDLY